jgi:hypothetical protein
MLAQIITTLWLVGTAGTARLAPTTVDVNWNHDRVPSCQVFEHRQRTLEKQVEEIGYLLDQLSKKPQPWSDSDTTEMMELLNREVNITRELRDYKIVVRAEFVLSDLTPETRAWIESRGYRIYAETPHMHWGSDHGYTPDHLSLEVVGDSLWLETSYHMGEYCKGENEIYVELTQL